MPIRKGSKLSPEHRRKISESLKNSDKFREAMRRRSYHFYQHRTESADSLRVNAMEKKLGVHCILLTKPVFRRLSTLSPTHQLLCHRCVELLREGEIVVSRNNGSRVKKKRRKYYHTRCWETMFIEVED